jgi:hypothetical protein
MHPQDQRALQGELSLKSSTSWFGAALGGGHVHAVGHVVQAEVYEALKTVCLTSMIAERTVSPSWPTSALPLAGSEASE